MFSKFCFTVNKFNRNNFVLCYFILG